MYLAVAKRAAAHLYGISVVLAFALKLKLATNEVVACVGINLGDFYVALGSTIAVDDDVGHRTTTW